MVMIMVIRMMSDNCTDRDRRDAVCMYACVCGDGRIEMVLGQVRSDLVRHGLSILCLVSLVCRNGCSLT